MGSPHAAPPPDPTPVAEPVAVPEPEPVPEPEVPEVEEDGLLSNITSFIQPLANLVVSNSVTTTNVFAVTANVGTLNVWQDDDDDDIEDDEDVPVARSAALIEEALNATLTPAPTRSFGL
jgi:hypothetical protein